MGNMKFDGADVTFELDGYDALVERVRSKKINCKINPSDLPRLYAVMDAELEGNEELAAAFAEAQEAAFGEAVLTVWAERIKSFKDSFIPVFGDACKDAACRFGFSKDGNNTFKSAVDAFAANICDLYGAAPQIVDGFCEFLARNACLEFDGYAADILQKAAPFDSKSVDQLADSLPLSGDARLCLQAAFLARYLQWSTDAFTLGLHLGLSLVHDNVRRGGPQQV